MGAVIHEAIDDRSYLRTWWRALSRVAHRSRQPQGTVEAPVSATPGPADARPRPTTDPSETRAAGGPYRSPAYPRAVVWAVRRARSARRRPPRIDQFRPRSTLVQAEHPVTTARYRAVDFHTHLGRWLTRDGGWMAPDVSELCQLMDGCNVETLVNLDGRWGDELEANLDRYDRAHPGRFATFCHLDWQLLVEQGNADDLVRSLERSAGAGARGLKVWKDLGLGVSMDRQLLLPDDPRLDPVWEAAGELGLPVLIHVADPVALFEPVGRHNERLEELLAHPRTSLAHLGPAHFSRLIRALEAVVARHDRTCFVGAHVGCFPENLGWIDAMLVNYPNFHIDLAGRTLDLGRQPRGAARLIERHSERVLFGTDAFPLRAQDFHGAFRMLETGDEHFSSTVGHSSGGGWPVSALELTDRTLEQVYRSNARRLLAGNRPAGTYLGPDFELQAHNDPATGAPLRKTR